MNMDEELREILKKLGFLVLGLVVCIGFLIIIAKTRFDLAGSRINDVVKNKETVYILVRKRKCENCKEIEKVLQQESMKYWVFNREKDKGWDTLKQTIGISDQDIVEPTLLFVKDGVLYSTYVEINDLEELQDYLDANTNS